MVVASDDAPGADDTTGDGSDDDEVNPTQKGYKKVVVTVTDEDERGMVTLSSRQPQVGVALTATLNAPEQSTTDTDITWKWEKSQDMADWAPVDGAPTAVNSYSVGGTTEDNYLRVTATYDDADGEERTAQAVTAMSVRTAPTTTDADASFPDGSDERSVDENSSAGANVGKPVAASDTQDDVLTYSLTGTNIGGFEIDSETGQITVGPRTMLNHEATPSYTDVTVTVTETSGDPTPINVTIMVNDVNEASMVTGGVTALKLAEYDADTDAGADAEEARAKTVSTYIASDPEEGTTLTWTLEGTDRDLFDITTDGALTFDDAPSYEAPADAGKDNTYNVTVVATDVGTGKGEKMTAKRSVVIMVTDVEEDGTVTLSAQEPKIGVPLRASVTDIDKGVTGTTWKWERDDDRFNLETNADMEETIEGAESATYTPTTKDDGKYLRAIASYTDGKGSDTSMVTSVAMVSVRTDNPPSFPSSESGKRSIDEGMTGDVGDPVRATDAETAQLLTYSLSGPDMGSFSITSDTAAADRGGQISVNSGVKLDHEVESSYMVTVTATDPDNLSAPIDVTISVTDVDEAPEITAGGLVISGMARVDYAEDRRDAVATYRASGPDAASATWSLEGADDGDFAISSSGELTFVRAPDFENPTDMGGDNDYQVTVEADDGTYMDTHDVTVTVTDVDEPVAPSDPLLAKYDKNPQDDRIGREEVLDGIDAFFLNPGPALREEVLDLIDRFFEDLGS